MRLPVKVLVQIVRPVNGQAQVGQRHVRIVAKPVMHVKTVLRQNAVPVRGRRPDKVLVPNALPVHIRQHKAQHQLQHVQIVQTVSGLMPVKVHVR